jgi:acetyl/propionyl-CoA carboxylase alpha subunit
MDYEFILDGKLRKVSVECKDGKEFAVVDGKHLDLSSHRVSSNCISLLIGGKSYLARVVREGEKTFVAIGASRFVLEEPEQESALAGLKGGASGKAEGTIKAPMPGLVIKVNVQEGKAVVPGESLVVVEAMKMEHDMRASFKAVVEKVHVKPGQQVDAFQALVELVPVE